MIHGKKHPPEKTGKDLGTAHHFPPAALIGENPGKLELILKCMTAGSIPSVEHGLESIQSPVPVTIIHAGIGEVNKSDILLAESASRLILGFEVGVIPKIDAHLEQYGIEIRLYNLIYRLIEDVREIAASLAPLPPEAEEVTGSAKVIKLFKSTRRGIILGCEVLSGFLQLENSFRVISGMGPIYTGRIESMHLETNNVQKTTAGQQVGLKIRNFQKARVGDLIECLKRTHSRRASPWRPQPGVHRIR